MDLKPAATDAFAYIAAVKDQLQGEPDKYQELINTLIEFQGNRLGMDRQELYAQPCEGPVGWVSRAHPRLQRVLVNFLCTQYSRGQKAAAGG